ncbi:15101_t:CDS:1, partial [Gigaspora rosea]
EEKDTDSTNKENIPLMGEKAGAKPCSKKNQKVVYKSDINPAPL